MGSALYAALKRRSSTVVPTVVRAGGGKEFRIVKAFSQR
jgi:hypothetical protein